MIPNETSLAARPFDVRRHNLALVTQQVATHEHVSRAELAKLTGLTKATVSVLVQELLDAGLLLELGPQPSGQVGRPRTALSINGDGVCGVGLEIGVDYLAVCVADLVNRVRFERIEAADNRGVPPARILDRAERLTAGAIAAAAAEGLVPAALGVALPGMVQDDGGRLLVAPNLGWSDVPIMDELRTRLRATELPILADNEANLAALAELWLGVGADVGDYVYVSAEVGIGAGLIVGGALFRGAHGFAGEIGHIVVDPSGPDCSCGGRGCLERVAGQEAILAAAGLPMTAATSVGHSDSPLPELIRILEEGDEQAAAALTTAGTALGIALAGVVNVLDAGTIVLGGIYAPLAPWLTEALEASLRRQVLAARARSLQVRVSGLGPDAAVRGAAAWVVQDTLTGGIAA